MADVSLALLTNLTLMSQYSAASGCSENHDSSFAGCPVYCGPEMCPLIDGANTELLYGFSKYSPSNISLEYHTQQTLTLYFFHYTGYTPAIRLVQEYSQSGPEYWITSGFGEPVTTADAQILEGVDNEQGNLGREPGSLRDHMWYLGPADACPLG
jgi:hypothetical protein